MRICIQKTNHKRLVWHSGHPWVLGLATCTWTHKIHHGPDSGVSHHLTPYSILCVTPWRGHSNGFLSRDSQSGVPKLSRVGVPRLWTNITSRPNLRSGRGLNQSCSPSKRAFERHVALPQRTSGAGRFSTFSGRESNCQFDSRPFFCP
jgi:hypothetical protein